MLVLGRDSELSVVDSWLRTTAEAEPGLTAAGPALVIEGEPGIGKTTLWAETVRRSRLAGWQVLTCRPAPSDAGLPHVGLADLLRLVPDEAFAQLPHPQRRPLGVALLREDAGDADLDPRAVGMGLTALLTARAAAGQLMLAVDDTQWLDPASARSLAFALRRVDDRRLRVVLAVRLESQPGRPPAGLAAIEAALAGQAVTRIPVGPLTVAALHQLFRQVIGRSFPRPVLLRIHRAAGGNPFYAIEIARELQRAGVPPPGQPLPVPGDSRELALLRLRRLPRATRDVLAVVAAMPRPRTGDLDLESLEPAERAGIVRVHPGGRIEFSHPLFGSALYSSLTESARRALHRGLAVRAATLEERARHLALGADGPDEATAAELDRAADAAGARGAADVAVELKELASRLTPPGDHPSRVRRDIELADRRYFAGDPAGARRELERSLRSLTAGEERARVLLELGSVLWATGEAGDGLELMLQALGEANAQSLRARIHSRISALADDDDLSVEHGEAALALLDEADDPQLYSFALHNVALFRLYAGRGADHEAIAAGMRLQQDAAAWEMSTVPAYWARNFDDFATARQRFGDLLRAFSEHGDEANTSGIMSQLAVIEALTGHLDRARELVQEAIELAGQTEQETLLNLALLATAEVHARAGELDDARRVASEVLGRLDAHPDVVFDYRARAVLGYVALTAGDLAEADRQLSRADALLDSLHAREPANERFHADHAEAVIGLGDLARAEQLVHRLEERAAALPRPWILVVAARCRGLLSAAAGDLEQALASYQSALAAHEGLDMPSEHGRTLLAIGRLYRRLHDRQHSRESLAVAVQVLESAGALGWAAAAAAEMTRTGQRRRDGDHLTAAEQAICELAASGLRNSEIAARLYLSGKTVEANLSRAYRKLGVRSRTELARHLAAEPQAGEPA